jgi:hypothetical protein
MSDGFLGRWSRRKEAAREGKALEPEPPLPANVAQPEDAPAATEAAPPPTLEDVQSLTPADDFTRFVQPDVPPDVKNAAMKRLFADPHFNQMDGLDVYIDDYGKPDPIPPEMLKKLASARFLKLFEEDEDEEKKKVQGREVADDPEAQSVAQSAGGAAVQAPGEDDADPDLRLQQDHAPGPEGPGQGDR